MDDTAFHAHQFNYNKQINAMKITETPLKGCFIIEPQLFEDDRGYFYESYNAQKLDQALGYSPNFVQDNQSKSSYGVVRGLHMQKDEHAQAKLVRVLEGSVLDVVVDVRKDSPTYAKSFAIELTADNKKQLFVPRGFLHGFSVLSATAVFFYKCDNFYNKASEYGINPLDPFLNIDWRIHQEDIILSAKDKEAKSFLESFDK